MEQAPSERMAALILDEEGFESIDPAHPLGGRDGGADALVQKDGEPAKLRLDGTPTPRSWVARMTKRPTPTGVGKSASITEA